MQLSLAEFAERMGMPVNTIERWIRQGRLPVRKRGDICIFDEQVLNKWASVHNLTFSQVGNGGKTRDEDEPESLAAAMRSGGIYYDIPGESVEEVLREAVDRMDSVDPGKKGILYANLLEREKMMSTGIGSGVAVPHPRTPISGGEIPAQIAICFLRNKIDYDAVDKHPVCVLFILVAPTARQHLHLLSRISFCLRDQRFLEMLDGVPDPKTLFDSITDFENRLDAPGK